MVFIVFSLAWIFQITLITSGAPDHIGKEFIFAIPQNKYDTINSIMLHVTTPNTTAVHVEISMPRSDDMVLSLRQFTVMGKTTELVLLHPHVSVRGTTMSTKAICIKASSEIKVYCINILRGSNDGFMVYPLDAIGNEYYTINYHPSTDACQFLVVATENNTNVEIRYPSNPEIQISYNGKTFGQGDIQTISIQKFDVLQIQDNADLTGTYITSDKNIVVIAGNKFTTINPSTNDTENDFGDTLVEQLIPVNAWGREFGFVATPKRTTGDILKFVGSENDTSIFLQCSDGTESTLTVDSGRHAQYHTSPGVVCHVASSKPIIVNLFTISLLNESESCDPSFVTITPFQQFSQDHRFLTPHHFTSYSHLYENYFIYIIKEEDINGLRINGQPLSSPIYQIIPGTSYVGGYVKIPHDFYIVYHIKTNVYFGGYVYGAVAKESYIMTTGLRLAPINIPCEPTISKYGDGIDNDCDGDIDEDICDIVNDELEDSADCARGIPIHGQWGDWGNELSRCYCMGVTYIGRHCNNPEPGSGGNPCFGDDRAYYSCTPTSECRVDGGFSSWSSFGVCSSSCGKGLKTRYRTCTNPSPAFEGTNCSGAFADIRECDAKPCPVDGNWGSWTATMCSQTCDRGVYYKYRSCDDPKPDHGGTECIGEAEMIVDCNKMSCNDVFSGGEEMASINSSPHISNFKTGLLVITIWIICLSLTTSMLQNIVTYLE